MTRFSVARKRQKGLDRVSNQKYCSGEVQNRVIGMPMGFDNKSPVLSTGTFERKATAK